MTSQAPTTTDPVWVAFYFMTTPKGQLQGGLQRRLRAWSETDAWETATMFKPLGPWRLQHVRPATTKDQQVWL